MSQVLESPIADLELAEPFVDRRRSEPLGVRPNRERRQFGDSHETLSAEARELADAIDQYKLLHRRRFITYQEMLDVMLTLGYRKLD